MPRRTTKIVATLQRKYLCLQDFEAAAEKLLPKRIFGYVQGANQDFVSLRDNRRVFDEIRFLPRILRNVVNRDMSVALFGERYDAPFGIAPMGICALTAYRGDLVLAAAAKQANIPMVLSSSALISIEDVAKVTPKGWFQLYVPRHEDAIDALIDRVARAGYKVLVVTADTSLVPVREDNLRNGFKTPLNPNLRLAWDGITHPRWLAGTFLKTLLRHGIPDFPNSQAGQGPSLISRNLVRDFSGREHLNWDSIRRIRQRWKGALVLKGILHPDDAALSAELGADGIIVSNHGGRQLDGTPSPMRVLERVLDKAGAQTVMIDSGFRRGNDVLKALALGAQFAFVGRPFNYAAAVAGEPGVSHAISLLKKEINVSMALLGINRLDELDASYLMGRDCP